MSRTLACTQDDHAHMCAQGGAFDGTPRVESYGMVAVFSDLRCNTWDLSQRAAD